MQHFRKKLKLNIHEPILAESKYSNNSKSYWTQIKQIKISDGLEKDPCLKLA